MTAALYHKKLARVLDAIGGLYTLNDILERVADGRMQSHVVNNSWIITQINLYPRARALSVVAMCGDLKDGEELHRRLVEYANKVDAGLIMAHGRLGWMEHARAHGWRLKARSYLYHRDM